MAEISDAHRTIEEFGEMLITATTSGEVLSAFLEVDKKNLHPDQYDRIARKFLSLDQPDYESAKDFSLRGDQKRDAIAILNAVKNTY